MRPFIAELIVEDYLHGVRIDSFLTRHFRNYTPWRMQRIVLAGGVKIEGATAGQDDRVFTAQRVEVRLLEPPDALLPPEPMNLEIIHEDPWLVVVNKPAGLVVHPCGMYATGSLANALQAHFDRQTPLKGLVRPGVVHRLDRLTSGVIAFSKEHVAHRFMATGFERGHVSKAYLALVRGTVRQDRGDINLKIGNTPGGSTIRMSTAADAVDARPSRTLYETVDRFDGFSLVLARPHTGRLHQIRVHLAAIGHPVLADEFYSDSGIITRGDLLGPHTPAPDEPLLARQALHARTLSFLHPVRREIVEFQAPLAADMQRALDLLREKRDGKQPDPSLGTSHPRSAAG